VLTRRILLVALLPAFSFSSISSLTRAASAAVDPCASISFGSALESASFAGTGLRLLSGAENPKLRRILEYQLDFASERAAGWLEKGAPLPDAPHPDLTDSFHRTEEYATTHLKGETVARLKRLYSALKEHDLAASKAIK
jgi:hypothetical protein